MLYRFMKSAGAVAIGLAVLLGWSAHAQVDLTPPTGTMAVVPVIAKETLPKANANKVHVLPDVAGADVVFMPPANTGGSHLRIDLIGGKWATTALQDAGVTGGTGCDGADVDFGGDVNSSYVVIECNSTDSTADINLDVSGRLGLNVGASSISMRVTQWFNRETALRGSSTVPQFKLGEISARPIINTKSLVTASVTMPVTTVASVAEDFKMFKDGLSGTRARLAGSIKTMLETGLVSGLAIDHPSPTDGTTDPTDLTAAGTISVDAGANALGAARAAFSNLTVTVKEESAQDLSFGTFFIAQDDPATADADEKADCLGTVAVPRLNLVDLEDHATGTVAVTTTGLIDGSLCVELTPRVPTGSPAGTKAVQAMVPTSKYTATVSFAAAAHNTGAAATGAGLKPDDGTGAAGVLNRDGTVVHIPFLTTASGYDHRLVIVNRNTFDAKYAVTFTDEDGVMSTAGDNATGMVPAMTTLTIPSEALVSVKDGNRTAATVTIVSPRSPPPPHCGARSCGTPAATRSWLAEISSRQRTSRTSTTSTSSHGHRAARALAALQASRGPVA